MSHILPNFLQVHCSSINLFYSEIGIIQFGVPKLQICPKHPVLFYFQHRTRICPKIKLILDEFLGGMGSKFEYTYFREICSLNTKIVLKHQNCIRTEPELTRKQSLTLTNFMGPMGSKFGYTYFRDIFSPRSIVYLEILITQFG